MNVRRNVEYGLRFRQLTAVARQKRTADVLESLGLGHLENRKAKTLSAGEGQRVALARALVLQPELLLLDEPVANVDEVNRPRVEAAVRDLQQKGCTVIVATHQVDQAYRFSANVVRLERGRIAPSALENLIEGEIEVRDGSSVIVISESLSIHIVTDRRGFARAALDPTSIVVSNEKLNSSARNCLPGRVIALSEREDRVAISVDVGVRLSAHITKQSFHSLKLTLGSEIFLTFKASAVTVF
jgi:tungstate transport system ATP-binding protein